MIKGVLAKERLKKSQAFYRRKLIFRMVDNFNGYKVNAMFLATTAIQDFWEPGSRLLLLGPWCLPGQKNKELVEGKDYIMVSSPWKPASKIKEAADYTLSVYEELLPRLSEALNSINKVSHPVKYWRILVGPWLLYFIGVFYDRYKRVENAISLFPDCFTYTIPGEKCDVSAVNTLDFLGNKINGDLYNLKLFSLIINHLYPGHTKQINRSSVFNTVNYRSTYSWKGKCFEEFLKTTNTFLKSSLILSDMYFLNKKDMLFLSFKSGISAVNFRHFTQINDKRQLNDRSFNLRDKLGNNRELPDKFLSLLYDILPYALPTCYIENYEFYRRKVKDLVFPKVIGSAVGWVFNERFKFFAAAAILKGSKIIEFQHGGGYGLSLANLCEELSLEKDIFYTWGFSSKEKNNKIKPLPSPHLSKLKDGYCLKRGNLLMVGANMPRYHIRFNTDLFPDDMPKYFVDKRIFLGGLNHEIRQNLLYRPFAYDYGWGEKELIKQEIPHIKLIEKGRLVDLMKKVKLVVIDHPHTSFLEALTINVPCVFYWDHDVYLMRAEAEPYFEEFRRRGVLFKGPQEAAEQVNRVFGNPKDWWLSKEVQGARRKFCGRFAYAQKDWLKIWVKEFKHVVSTENN